MTEKAVAQAPFVASSLGRLRSAVVVRPNAALATLAPLPSEPSPILDRALEQHAIFVRTLTDHGVVTTVLDPGEDGESTFVRDAAVVLERGAVMLRPSRLARRKEAALVEGAMETLGVPIIGRIDSPGLLDGGDIVIAGDIAYVGVVADPHRARSNALGRSQFAQIAAAAGMRVIELALAPSATRLCAVFSVIADDLVVAAPEAVDVSPLGKMTVIEIPLGESHAADVLSLGSRSVIANLRFRVALPMLRKARIAVEAIDLWEFGKIGAGPSSLALAFKRD